MILKYATFALISSGSIVACSNGASAAYNFPTRIVSKHFVVSADGASETMCEKGMRITSVSAVAKRDNRYIPILLLDADRKPIEGTGFAAAFGFKLKEKIPAEVDVMLFCGQ